MEYKQNLSSLCLTEIHNLDEQIRAIYSKIPEIERIGCFSTLLSQYKTLLDFELFFYVFNADYFVLLRQLIESNIRYEIQYAAGRLYSVYNEGFKQLYGFYDSRGNRTKRKWDSLQSSIKLLNSEINNEYSNITQKLDIASKDPAYGWWKDIRNAENHSDAAGICKFRLSFDDKNKVINDAQRFLLILQNISGFIVKMESCFQMKINDLKEDVEQYLTDNMRVFPK